MGFKWGFDWKMVLNVEFGLKVSFLMLLHRWLNLNSIQPLANLAVRSFYFLFFLDSSSLDELKQSELYLWIRKLSQRLVTTAKVNVSC